MTTSSSSAQEASRQARLLQQNLLNYQKTLPANRRLDGPGVCRADGWEISYQQLNGDFDLDEILAQNMVTSAQASSPDAAAGTWLEQYLLGDVTGDVSSGPRFKSEFNNATAGPGNILGNVNALKQAGNAFYQKSTMNALQAAARRIETGAAISIKINEYMTLYNANRSGRGRPRPRVRISGMPLRVITPALNQGMRVAASGTSTAMKAADLLAAQRLGNMAAASHWTSKAAYLNGKIGGGVLTFAPSAALDIYTSVERDMAGDMRFNRNKFLIASAKSQSGNVLGMAGGAMAAAGVGMFAVAVVGVTLTAAPLILIGLVGGVAIQMIWGASGGADWAGSAAERALKP